MVLISNSDCISVTIRDNIYGDWSGQTYKIAKSDSLKHIFQHYSGKCEIQLPRFAFDVHNDLSIDCQQSSSDLGIKNNDTIWVLSCITKSKRFGCHDGTVRYYSHFSGWSRVSSLFSEEVLGLDMLATFGTSTQMLLKLHNDHHRQKIDYEIEKNKEEIRLTNSSNGSPTPAPMEVDNEAEVVGATGVEFEVEDVPLEEDREFCRTILSPENNLRPTGDEWIVPIVLFPEPGKATNKEVDQVKPTSTVPMEVEEEQSPEGMEHPVHQQQQQPSTEHVADKDALTKKVSEKKVSKKLKIRFLFFPIYHKIRIFYIFVTEKNTDFQYFFHSCFFQFMILY